MWKVKCIVILDHDQNTEIHLFTLIAIGDHRSHKMLPLYFKRKKSHFALSSEL